MKNEELKIKYFLNFFLRLIILRKYLTFSLPFHQSTPINVLFPHSLLPAGLGDAL